MCVCVCVRVRVCVRACVHMSVFNCGLLANLANELHVVIIECREPRDKS